MKTIFEVDITKIKVDQKYYSFNYKIKVNGVLKVKGTYDSDHCWYGEEQKFKKMLEEGYAAEIALERL